MRCDEDEVCVFGDCLSNYPRQKGEGRECIQETGHPGTVESVRALCPQGLEPRKEAWQLGVLRHRKQVDYWLAEPLDDVVEEVWMQVPLRMVLYLPELLGTRKMME